MEKLSIDLSREVEALSKVFNLAVQDETYEPDHFGNASLVLAGSTVAFRIVRDKSELFLDVRRTGGWMDVRGILGSLGLLTNPQDLRPVGELIEIVTRNAPTFSVSNWSFDTAPKLQVDEALRIILGVGKSLAPYGSNNWALTRSQALAAIGAIERASRVVLGGDIWRAVQDRFSVTGDSWYFNPRTGGSHAENVRDSAEKARQYVSAYPDFEEGIPHFELVVR
jgi:hypothetical protein